MSSSHPKIVSYPTIHPPGDKYLVSGGTIITTPDLKPEDLSQLLKTIIVTSREEVDLLQRVVDGIGSLDGSKSEFIWNTVLQVLGILFVIVFGAFSVLAYTAARIANKQSLEAN